ncbi:MAG: hypothetical protein P8166_03765 [Candidatus Thiodiazotropha sp.]
MRLKKNLWVDMGSLIEQVACRWRTSILAVATELKLHVAIVLGLTVFASVCYPAGRTDMRFGGFVELDHISYAKNPDHENVNGRSQIIVQPELEARIENSRLFGSVEFRADESDSSRDRSYVNEAYVDFTLMDMDIRIGKQIIAWGKADAYNPTDNVVPVDFSDLIDTDDEEIGVVILRVNYYVGDLLVQGVVQPTFTPNTFPDSNSRWYAAPSERIVDPGGSGNIVAAEYELLPEKIPDESKLGKAAIKLAWFGVGMDLSISYLRGWSHIPFVAESVSSVLPGVVNVGLQPVYFQQDIFGADFSTAVGKYGLRGEIAHFDPNDESVDEDDLEHSYTQYSLGIDRTISNIINDNDLYVLLEVIGDNARKREAIIGDYLRHPFRRATAVKVEYSVGYTSTWSVEGIRDHHGDGYYLKTKVSYALTDAIQLEGWIENFDGEKDSLFGVFKNNDRIQLRAKYRF